jgi:hypothetical protein
VKVIDRKGIRERNVDVAEIRELGELEIGRRGFLSHRAEHRGHREARPRRSTEKRRVWRNNAEIAKSAECAEKRRNPSLAISRYTQWSDRLCLRRP